MNDRYNIQNQVEHLQMKYVGTGHADITKWEWGTNMVRDTLASHVGHHSRLVYFACAENQTTSRQRYDMLMDMIRPTGAPPKEKKDMF
mmetsp:Transcript_75740/g.88097  ORF Transcript_75740/g.88097 Transcript_75740/m.88097 type:complete len:88 (-) Transcript_75740:169-432(-)